MSFATLTLFLRVMMTVLELRWMFRSLPHWVAGAYLPRRRIRQRHSGTALPSPCGFNIRVNWCIDNSSALGDTVEPLRRRTHPLARLPDPFLVHCCTAMPPFHAAALLDATPYLSHPPPPPAGPALFLYPTNDLFIPKMISLVPSGNRVKIGRQTNTRLLQGSEMDILIPRC